MIISKENLLSALNSMVTCTSDKTKGLEALNGIMFDNGNLYATDLENSVQMPLNGLQETFHTTDEKFIIPKSIIPILQKFYNEDVELKVENNILILSQGKTKSTFTTYNIEDYPENNINFYNSNKIDIKLSTIMNGLNFVKYATSVTENKPIFTGVLINADINSNCIDFVACDGYRLALNKIELQTNEKLNNNFKIIIPKKTIEIMSKIFQNCNKDDILNFEYDNKKMKIQIGNIVFTSLLLVGDFLDYNLAIPKHSNYIKINRNDFLRSLDLAKITAINSINKHSLVTIVIDDYKILIKSQNSTNEFSDSIDLIENQNINNLKIGFNVIYLIDMLKQFTDDEIILYFANELSPIIAVQNQIKAMVLPTRLKN